MWRRMCALRGSRAFVLPTSVRRGIGAESMSPSEKPHDVCNVVEWPRRARRQSASRAGWWLRAALTSALSARHACAATSSGAALTSPPQSKDRLPHNEEPQNEEPRNKESAPHDKESEPHERPWRCSRSWPLALQR